MSDRHGGVQVPKAAAMSYKAVVGANIARLRRDRGKTQAEMGEEVRRFLEGLWSKATVSAIENGKRPLEVSELVMIAIVLEVPVAELLDPTPGAEPMLNEDRVRLRDKKMRVRVDEIRRAVAPTSDEQTLKVVERVTAALGVATPATVAGKGSTPPAKAHGTGRKR